MGRWTKARRELEVFGDYYHANPQKYKPTDKIKLFKVFSRPRFGKEIARDYL